MTAQGILAIGLPLTAAMADTVAGVVALAGARDRRIARSFVVMVSCMALWSAAVGLESIPGFTTEHAPLLSLLSVAFLTLPAAGLHNAVVWSGVDNAHIRHAAWLGYGAALLLCILHACGLVFAGFVNYPWGSVNRPGPLYPFHAAFSVLTVCFGTTLCWGALKRSESSAVRLRAKYWLLGVSAFAPLGFVNYFVGYGLPVFPTGSIGNILLVGLYAYAVVCDRLMDIDAFVMRAAATSLAGVAMMLPAAGALIWVRHMPLAIGGPVVTGCLLASITGGYFAFSRFRSYIEQGVESSLFPGRWKVRDALRQLSADLVKLPHTDEVGQRFAGALVNGLGLTGVALYLKTPKPGCFKLAYSEGTINAPARLDGTALIPQSPTDQTVVVAHGADDPNAGVVAGKLEWDAYVPLWIDGTCMGLIALGAKRSGAVIDDTDVTLLGVVSAQLGIAMKNAEYVHEIERQKTAIEALQKRLAAENVALREEVRSHSQFKEIIGSSSALQRVLALVEKVAPTKTSILITGETGTGKELIARAIHELSTQRDGPLISVNCPAIPPTLAESELFGHERGAFTDAREARPGKFELADGGTLFLDEVADLPLDVQVKLLRVLQEKETQRLGARSVRKIDLRVVAATNRDLQAEMQGQRFRQDLYHRLAGVVVTVPPLRQRTDDIPMLASCFLDRATVTYQRPIRGFSSEAMTALRRYNWPGNIRELQNVVERAVLLCTSEIIKPEHLSDLAVGAVPTQPFGSAIRAEKLRRVEQALAQTGGNRSAAARLLGISPSNLDRLMKSLGIKPAPLVQ